MHGGRSMEAAETDWRGSGLHRAQFPESAGTLFEPLPGLMKSKYPTFDRSRLRLRPLAERKHDLSSEHWLELEDEAPAFEHSDLGELADRIKGAKKSGAARVLIMGAHVIRAGVNR